MSHEQFDPNSLDATLATIIANQASNAKAVNDKLDQILETNTTLETRVAALERWRLLILGGAITVGAVIHFLVDLVKH